MLSNRACPRNGSRRGRSTKLPTRIELNLVLDILYQGSQPYRAVIVDEGQDFEADWWEVVNACLPEDGAGCMVVFLDDNPRGKSFDMQRRFAAVARAGQPAVQQPQRRRDRGARAAAPRRRDVAWFAG